MARAEDASVQEQAAKKIQATYRGHAAREDLHKQEQAATKMESAYRGYAVRSELERCKKANSMKRGILRLHVSTRGHAFKRLQGASRIVAAFRADHFDSDKRIRRDLKAYKEAVDSGTVVVDVESTEQLEKIPLRVQGNEHMYSTENLTERRHCRKDFGVGSEIEKWWGRFHELTEFKDGMLIEEYCVMNIALHLVLSDPDATDANLVQTAAEDWVADSESDFAIDRTSFFDAIFELADIWTHSTSPHEYIAFLRVIRESVERILQTHGERIFRLALKAKEMLISGKCGSLSAHFLERRGKTYDRLGRELTRTRMPREDRSEYSDAMWCGEDGTPHYFENHLPVPDSILLRIGAGQPHAHVEEDAYKDATRRACPPPG